MPQAVVLMHEVGGDGWETKKVKAGKDGLIDLKNIKSFMDIGVSAVVKVRSDQTLICDENAAFTD
jgi:hypothetical protein